MFIRKLFVAGVAIGTCSLAFGQDYFDFGKIPGVPDKPAIQVDLNPMLLGIASAAARADNPAVADLLSDIEGVRVRIYSSIEDADDVVRYVERTASQLEKDDWQSFVTVEDNGQVRVFVRGDTETITGVTAMIVNDAQALFVNVSGSISAEQLVQSIGADSGKLLASLSGITTVNKTDP